MLCHIKSRGPLSIILTMSRPAIHLPYAHLLVAALGLLLAGCDIPGLGPDPRIAQREAEAQAIGAACRHAQRSLEDCYALNAKAPKAAVFAGWKDMDQYMRDNKIEGIPPQLSKSIPPANGEAGGNTEAPPAADAASKS